MARSGQRTTRVLALWCPDWPASAAASTLDLEPGHPVAVLRANRVIACSPTARQAGVRRGMRKRQAQSACPEMVIAGADADRDGRCFEPLVAAVLEVMPAAEVLRPGLMVMSLSSTLHHHVGSEAVLAERLIDVIAACGVEAQVGVADEMFTAVIAARDGRHVAPGLDAEHLAPLPISMISAEESFAGGGRDELVELLRRLGLTTLGAFAALSVRDVGTRFGSDAVLAHRQANGLPGRPPVTTVPVAELVVEHSCDPPLERVDVAAFLGRRLADELHELLTAGSVACTRLTVEAITERGQRHSRTWRCVEPLTAEATADRIRWQLEGWLTGGRGTSRPPDSPVCMLRLIPVEVADAAALQYGLSGAGLPDGQEDDERARRCLARVQGLLGGDAVKVPTLRGGRGPAEQVHLVTLGEDAPDVQSAPWPGRLPQPAPSVVLEAAVSVLDPAGTQVEVSARGAFTSEPTTLTLHTQRRRGRESWEVKWWAGPWPTGFDADGVSARAQVLLDDARALLLHYRRGEWVVEGVYD